MIQFSPLDIVADLDLDVEGERVHIAGEEQRIVVQVPNARAGARLLRSGPFASQRGKRLEQTNRALQATGLTLEVRVGEEVIARLGKEARPGSLARLLRMSTELRPVPVVRKIMRSPRMAWGIAAAIAGAALAGFLWWQRQG